MIHDHAARTVWWLGGGGGIQRCHAMITWGR